MAPTPDASGMPRTVDVPAPFAPIFLRAEEYVRRYFADRVENPEAASVQISGERYLLVRAASLSVEFFDLVTSLYADKGPVEAASVATNLLFDIAHAIGSADARAFGARMKLTDPIERLSAGPIHFSFAGWAFVRIFPESNPAPDDSYYLIYDHPFSFESDAWRRQGRRAEFPVCVMNAGYSSGWCEESFGLPLVAAEVACQARGDAECRFIMAPPHRIEEHLARYRAGHAGAAGYRGSDAPIAVPEFFQRKRMEDALRAANEQLERRVQERTRELEAANKALQQEMLERELAEEERRRVQVKLLHAQKLESLGVLAGGIAHDFNNLLVGVLGNAGLALQDLPPDAKVRDTIKDIETAALRAAELTHQLLAYAGKGQYVVQAVQLSHLVEEMSNLLATAVSKNAKIEYRFPRALPAVQGDATQLRQIVMNLITNASEAIGAAGGTIRVSTGVVQADRAYLADAHLGPGLPDGDYVYMEVQDTGHGMHASTVARIFDPFFSTKFTGRGLGLAAVLGIVRTHHGAIKVQSSPGQGTTIRVLLPSAGMAATTVPTEHGADVAEPVKGRTVLVVDDEEQVRSVARRILSARGFAVRLAAGGSEAVEVVREAPDAVDCVLLDLTMPDRSGVEVMDELHRIRPDLKIILSSGYTQESSVPPAGAGGGHAAFIQKPYRPADLVNTVRAVLE
jgi:signal transduction histidine kinase